MRRHPATNRRRVSATLRARFGSRGLRRQPRRGAVGSLDYVLVLGVILPLVTIVMPLGRRIIQLVYEMMLVFIAWPFL